MCKFFYARLAANNLRKNGKVYLPYLLTCLCTVAMYYIIFALSKNPGLQDLPGSDMLQFSLQLGHVVIAFFAVIFLFYTHSFLIKRRRKEFGVFNILGMEKKHLARMMLYETLYTAALSLGIGLLTGLLLGKLVHLILLKILRIGAKFSFGVCWPAMGASLVLFGFIFALTLLYSLRHVHLAKPVELLRGGQTGEREPKSNWLLAVFGVICLGAGYYIAWTTKSPLLAITMFFWAVLLVIAGTYSLFTAGSIVGLKMLRKNKTYYYQTGHFITVSGMIYRMKQNAVGLANICILSTMVLVMLSSTASLYMGAEDALRNRYPTEITVNGQEGTAENAALMTAAIDQILAEQGLAARQRSQTRYLYFTAVREGTDTFSVIPPSAGYMNDLTSLYFLPQEDVGRAASMDLGLAENEAVVYGSRLTYDHPTLTIGDQTFQIVKSDAALQYLQKDGAYNGDVLGTLYVIVSDMETIEDLDAMQAAVYGKNRSSIRVQEGFDLEAPEETLVLVRDAINQRLWEQGFSGEVESRTANRHDFYALYGGLFFLGLFLALLFLMATVLILYYKQISEGYDDRQRFVIMRQVGLSRQEIKRTIRAQTVIMFFMPLGVAGLHIVCAFPIISLLLAVLNLTNVPLFMISTGMGFVVFAVFYAAVYVLTARIYYRIVGEEVVI